MLHDSTFFIIVTTDNFSSSVQILSSISLLRMRSRTRVDALVCLGGINVASTGIVNIRRYIRDLTARIIERDAVVTRCSSSANEKFNYRPRRESIATWNDLRTDCRSLIFHVARALCLFPRFRLIAGNVVTSTLKRLSRSGGKRKKKEKEKKREKICSFIEWPFEPVRFPFPSVFVRSFAR